MVGARGRGGGSNERTAPLLRRLSDNTEGTGRISHRLLLVPKHIVKASAPSMTILLICS